MRAILALPQFLRFAVVGVAGFLVDASALYGGIYLLGLNPYTGRALSYLCAATTTWYLNRTITFPEKRSTSRFLEWLRFLGYNSAGGIVNYAVYAVVLRLATPSPLTPGIGVGLGACAGLAVNYTLSRKLVFRSEQANGVE